MSKGCRRLLLRSWDSLPPHGETEAQKRKAVSIATVSDKRGKRQSKPASNSPLPQRYRMRQGLEMTQGDRPTEITQSLLSGLVVSQERGQESRI